jgi:hypothetical protein
MSFGGAQLRRTPAAEIDRANAVVKTAKPAERAL